MGFIKKIFQQAIKPTGRTGWLLGKSMNMFHYKLHCWGLSHISVKPDDIVLDIGCGGGNVVKKMANNVIGGKVYGVDYSDEMVRLSQRVNKRFVKNGKVEIKHGSVSALPFDDDMFDFITAFETTYFWPDFINDLKEIKRVLKSGGTLVIANEVYTHEKFEKRNRFINNLVEMQLHTPEGYRSLLTDAGYSNVSVIDVSEKNWIAAIARK